MCMMQRRPAGAEEVSSRLGPPCRARPLFLGLSPYVCAKFSTFPGAERERERERDRNEGQGESSRFWIGSVCLRSGSGQAKDTDKRGKRQPEDVYAHSAPQTRVSLANRSGISSSFWNQPDTGMKRTLGQCEAQSIGIQQFDSVASVRRDFSSR